MDYLTLEKAEKKLRKWKVFYFVSLLLPSGLFFFYAFYALTYTPQQQTILLNQLGGVYSNEDLGKTNITEGQLKQFAHKGLRLIFSYDYLSFVDDSDYQALVSGKKDGDLPDHRDKLKPWFSPKYQDKIIQQLKDAPWMKRFHTQQKQVKVRITSPPAQEGAYGWVKGKDGKLTQTYNGHLFVHVEARREKTQTYKVTYKMVLERKPLFLDNKEGLYYFAPLVPPNLFEWRIRSLVWDQERRL